MIETASQENIRQWFDIIYQEPQSHNEFIWTRSNVKKFVNFIEQNKHCFESEGAKRKSKIYINAAQFMGPPFANVKLRRRFDTWLKKYCTVDRLIKMVKRDIWLSIRNEKIFQELDRKKNGAHTQIEQKQRKKEDEVFFSITDGQITFAR